MFIGLIQTLSAGAEDVACFLKDEGYTFIAIEGQPCPFAADNTFASAPEMLSYVTSRWSQSFVTMAQLTPEELATFTKRPFFLLVGVTGKINARFNRYKQINASADLDEFISRSESMIYDDDGALLHKFEHCQLKLVNETRDDQTLRSQLRDLHLENPERLRPNWDAYFMSLADLAALRSNCMKRRVGAVIVRENRVIATGYNGTPRHFKNCNEGGCARCNAGDSCGTALSTCLCLHAEENALLESGRDRIGDNATLYCNTCPCLTCSIKIVQAGIRQVVYSQSYSMDTMSAEVFHQAGITLRQYTPPRSGVVILE